ncbi:MAG: hypothetical protein GF344_19585, partial [Chitinivibrionales bacterium]|nr:hypothetical protein [Chitinivibrionales bacterium]MBD3358828.1 hypothetical protein [Chitinivibrionales bacterium]
MSVGGRPLAGPRILRCNLFRLSVTFSTSRVSMDIKPSITVIGLGYVGLPLAVELAGHFSVKGFDINEKRIRILQAGKDPNGEVADEDLANSGLEVSAEPHVIAGADILIIAVPTPIDDHKTPDLTPVIKASETVGRVMKKGAIVCY